MLPVLFLRVQFDGRSYGDPLEYYDPLNDWLISKSSYLTWREWSQRTSVPAAPYAVMQDSSFVFAPNLEWTSPQFDWMRRVMEGRSRGRSEYTPSAYRGLLQKTPSLKILPKDDPELTGRLSNVNYALRERAGEFSGECLREVEHRPGSSSAARAYMVMKSGLVRTVYATPGDDLHQVWEDLIAELVLDFQDAQIRVLQNAA